MALSFERIPEVKQKINTIKMKEANSYWVWTKKAQERNPKRSRAGERIWDSYQYKAPECWLTEGLILDALNNSQDRQLELNDFMKCD
ncbi:MULTISPECIES: hypothetical protein [Paenibacillus]|uniref:hypothetical protein n=1 Tax=Paenibacillus TaxID=44249 RepID=UPI0009A89FD7|nr:MULTISPECIES: hypothetical protein [Paenibacillus]MCZ1269052.1 hypothetical protein [Paenibacillus tundrae]SLK16361.1 hypothetical protein SAMN06272722_110145 [Paenibacillus sp. RU5A]SOC74346.1 hypothetical protein SAMN05880581_110145 [Paenibacillus sp. RU26A]SOC76468.1 hypothetical protein SAMN05880586_110145 [Paenibacillus sp. RU5M]